MSAALSMPEGFEILDLAALEEEAQHSAVAADDAAQAVAGFVKLALANATAGGVTLTAADVAKLLALVNLVAGRTAETVEACDTVVFARLEGVR